MALSDRELRGGGEGCARALALAVGLFLAPAPPALAQVEAERWSLSATGSLIYAEDLLYLGESGPDDMVGAGGLGLGWARVGPRTQLTASGFASYRHYRDLDLFDGGRAVLGGSASHAFTPRVRGSASYGFSKGISALGLGLDQVLLPDIDIRTHTGTAGLSFQLTPRTSASLSGSVSRFEYRADRSFEGSLLPFLGEGLDLGDFGLGPGEDGQPVVADPFEATRLLLATVAVAGAQGSALSIDSYRAGLGLSHSFSEQTQGSLSFGGGQIRSDGAALQPTGRQLDAGAGLSHRLAPTWDLSLSYSFLTNDAQIPRVNTHNALVGLGKRLSTRLVANAAVGVGIFEAGGTTSRNLLGNVGLTARGDHTSFSLAYSRSTIQALALGRSFVSDFVTASWGRIFSRKLSASFYAAYQNSRDPLDDYDFDSQIAGFSLSRRIHERTAVSASYSFRRLGRQDLPTIQGSVLGLSISYGRVWK